MTISQVLFKRIVQEQETVIGRVALNQNPRKLSVKKLIPSEVTRFQPASLQKRKLFHIYSSMHFTLISSERIKITSSEEALKL